MRYKQTVEGLIPFTPEEEAEWDAMEAEHESLAAQRLRSEIISATQQRLDDFARTRNYDGILSLCTYATDPNPTFAAEGQCGVNARSSTWAALYGIMAEVEAGTRPAPTSYADVEPDLPTLTWPA